MKKYVLTWLAFLTLCFYAQLTPLQRFQDIDAVRSIIVSNNRILAATGQNIILTSTDSGVTWDEINSPLLQGINKLTIAGNSLIYACGENGKIIRSTDNGNSWQEINLGTGSDFTAVSLMSDLSYIVCTGSGEVFKGERPFVFTDVKDESPELPVAFTLGNYPNPFNGSTVINFTLPNESDCKLEVFSPIGSRVFESEIKGL
ncbi:hypothetical protein MASR1M107_01490 [Ignavibacteriales bacterium]